MMLVPLGQPLSARRRGERVVGLGFIVLAVILTLALAGCDGILDVDDSGVILEGEIDDAGPSALPTLVNGMVGNYHMAVDDIVLYTALLTDEMVMAGTFPDRLQVDRRAIPTNNASLGEVWSLIHVARFQADLTVARLQENLTDSAFAAVVGDLREGIVLGMLYGGYARLWLAELYCQSILTGMADETAPLSPDDRVLDAIALLEAAEAEATTIGRDDVRLAARVGQARGHLWLGNYGVAEDLADDVPRSFIYWSEYSNNDPEQYNSVYRFTWGDPDLIHWTVGDGSRPDRGFEQWEHIGEWISLNLLRYRPPGFVAQSSAIPVALQTIYGRPEGDILMASGVEAYLIRAEAQVRALQTAGAETLLNDLRSDHALRARASWGVDLPDPVNMLAPLGLSGTMETDLKTVADERARELWLTGDRMTTARRLRLDGAVSIDLFPAVKVGIAGGDDIAFPIPQAELDRNPNVGAACPVPQGPGSWM